MAVGSESGVVNIYDAIAGSAAEAKMGVYRPKPLHAVMNLTTAVTTAKFNFDAQVRSVPRGP